MRDQFAGAWYGDMPTDDGARSRWLTRRKLDGTYTIEFVVAAHDGSVSRQTEFGDWGVSGNYLVTVTRGIRDRQGPFAADKRDSYLWDVYKIIRFDSVRFEYENVSSGNRFSVRRVDPSFSMPRAETPVRLIDAGGNP